jgi:1-acyl-sn-glycerol-3-phosphate acyltransferase
MAIGSQLLRVPMMLIREALLAMGCCPADANTLRRELLAGTSIAITPGGWKESRHLCSYNLILQKRLGFVALAVETGAQLVPVLCLGEQDLVGPATFWYWWVKYLACNRPMPVRVVFGPAMAARDGESVVQLHARYIEALLAMGKQHGVQLQVVE